MMILSFLAAIAFFLLVGVASSAKATTETSDYLLAGQTVTPLFVGLSAAASWCSGFMFIGQIGFSYARGLSSIWIMIGLIAGDFIVSRMTHQKIRIQTEKKKLESYVEVLLDSDHKYSERSTRWAEVLVALVAMTALVGYASAQIMSSGIAFYSVLSIPYSAGAMLTTALLAVYCFSGGIRASIWTDVAQAIVMMGAMLILFVYSLYEIGGFGQWMASLTHVSETYLSIYPPDIYEDNFIFLALILIGWLAGGVGVAGQPHVMVRFMALSSEKLIHRARFYYFSYYAVLYGLAVAIGLCARILMPELPISDQEMALPLLAKLILPEFLVGIILAGLLASTMSSADSLIISSSATLTRDLIPSLRESYTAAKITTLSVAGLALALALISEQTVFQVVIIFGGLLSACLAPVAILKALGLKLSPFAVISMILVSATGTTLWRELGFSFLVYEVAVGILLGVMVGWIFCLKTEGSP